MIFRRACLWLSSPARHSSARRTECRRTPKGINSFRLFSIFFLLVAFSSTSFPQARFSHYNDDGPTIRVSLRDNVHAISLRLNGNYKLRYEKVTIAAISDSTIRFSFSADGTPVANLPNQEVGFLSPITIVPADSPVIADTFPARNDGVKVGSQTYPDDVEIIPDNNRTFRIVNVVPLETYLRGVVPNELVNDLSPDEFQACMAQAIAARNFAFYRMSQMDTSSFDVYGDTRDQVYSGIGGYKLMTDSAIQMTRGMIVEYMGEPARCFFHSTCGGHTANVQDVWQGQPPLPYLSGVSDIDSMTGVPFCTASPKFDWTTVLSGATADKLVKENLAMANPTYAKDVVHGHVDDLVVLDRFESSRVDTLEIKMSDGDDYFVRGDRTRYLFDDRDRLLNSSMFTVRIVRRPGGRIERVVLQGKGNGHGVGMCQWGAIGMSKAGYDYKQILGHYYPGTEIEKVY